MFRDHAGFSDLRKAVKAYEDLRKQMLAAITNAAMQRELAADKLIAELFELAESVELTDRLWETCGVKKLDRGGEPDRWDGLVAGLPG